ALARRLRRPLPRLLARLARGAELRGGRLIMADLDPCAASATAIAAAIRTGALSSREAGDACLARSERLTPQLNALVARRAEGARADADAADAARAQGRSLGPLHGVPITVKDSFDTAGLVTTWGTPGRRGFVPTEDATAV